MHKHPELALNIELLDRSVDLIEEGYDLGIRTGPTTVTGLVAWQLMALDYVVFAAPAYIARHGEPAEPADLREHHCLTGTENTTPTWTFQGPNGAADVQIYGRLQINNALLRLATARAGAGIMMCAEYLVIDDINQRAPCAAVAEPQTDRWVRCMRSAPPIGRVRQRCGALSVISPRN